MASILLAKAASIVDGQQQVPGTVTISDVSVLWKPEAPGTAADVSILLADIEGQGTKKPSFLRIAKKDGKALILNFLTVDDRTEVVEQLKERKHVAGAGLRADERKRLFDENKDLEALYNQLVATGILTEAEFWSNHGHAGNVANRLASSANTSTSGAGAAASKTGKPKAGMRLGLSSVLHEVERSHDGKTEKVHVTLMPEDIERIFRYQPEVNRAFIAYVPHSMSEDDFWKEYFKLDYKNIAKRKGAGGSRSDRAEDKDDIFAPFREHLDEEASAMDRTMLRNVDPTLDLFSEYVGSRWSGGSRSMGADTKRSDEAVARATAKLKSLANDLNRHSIHVLDGPIVDLDAETMRKDKLTTEEAIALATSVDAARKELEQAKGSAGVDANVEQDAVHKMRAASDLADLRGERVIHTVPLSINDKMAFLRIKNRKDEGAGKGPERVEEGEGGEGGKPRDITMRDAVEFEVDPWALVPVPYELNGSNKALEEFCAMDSARFVEEFGPAGLAAASVSPENALGGVMVEFFRLEALKTDELLRHFWSIKLSAGSGDAGGGSSKSSGDGNTQKMLRLQKHLAVQREALDAHIRNAASQGANQIYISKICESLVDQIDAAIVRV